MTLTGETIRRRLGSNPLSRKIPSQEITNEGGLSDAVLSNQEHLRLGCRHDSEENGLMSKGATVLTQFNTSVHQNIPSNSTSLKKGLS
jgi:hypothetical protein